MANLLDWCHIFAVSESHLLPRAFKLTLISTLNRLGTRHKIFKVQAGLIHKRIVDFINQHIRKIKKQQQAYYVKNGFSLNLGLRNTGGDDHTFKTQNSADMLYLHTSSK